MALARQAAGGVRSSLRDRRCVGGAAAPGARRERARARGGARAPPRAAPGDQQQQQQQEQQQQQQEQGVIAAPERQQAAAAPAPGNAAEAPSGDALALIQTWWPEARRTFPKVPWGPTDLVKVMGASLAAAGAFAALNALWLQPPHAGGGAEAESATALSEALRHLAREGALAALLPGAVLLTLRPHAPQARGLLQARWDAAWAGRTLVVCALLFPLVDPLLFHAWAPAAEALFGPLPPGSGALAEHVRAAAAAGDWPSLGAHLAASAAAGPLWEEVFWRGFFLASLAKVLPPPAAAAASSLGFAALHLAPANFAPLLALSFACDALYLRTHNLLCPLLLHGLWNATQLLAIAFLGKHEFV